LKRQFDKKLLFLIVLVSVAIGIIVWNVNEKLQGYAPYIALSFFALCTITYSLILGRLDKTNPLKTEKEAENKEQSKTNTPTYSLFLSKEEVQAATSNIDHQDLSKLQEDKSNTQA